MRSKKIDNTYILRLDTGEEISDVLKKFCADNNIKTGIISGIGSAGYAKLALFDYDTRKFFFKEVDGTHEICSLTGNISRMDNDAYLHMHISLADKEFKTTGGHLAACRVASTCEIMITCIDGEAERIFSEQVGLNIFDI